MRRQRKHSSSRCCLRLWLMQQGSETQMRRCSKRSRVKLPGAPAAGLQQPPAAPHVLDRRRRTLLQMMMMAVQGFRLVGSPIGPQQWSWVQTPVLLVTAGSRQRTTALLGPAHPLRSSHLSGAAAPTSLEVACRRAL